MTYLSSIWIVNSILASFFIPQNDVNISQSGQIKVRLKTKHQSNWTNNFSDYFHQGTCVFLLENKHNYWTTFLLLQISTLFLLKLFLLLEKQVLVSSEAAMGNAFSLMVFFILKLILLNCSWTNPELLLNCSWTTHKLLLNYTWTAHELLLNC